MPCARWILTISFAGLSATQAWADPAADCRDAAAQAAAETGIPLAILTAVMLAETGRAPSGAPGAAPSPWPWTVQANGQGRWFPSRAAALAHAQGLIEAGQRNIDLGCFQINLRWHGDAFPSLGDMFDPLANARHAAAFLSDLADETGDWRLAAGAYHSRDPARAEAYVVRLERIHAAQSDAAPPPASRRPGARGPLVDLSRRNRPLVATP
ncbi:MAG TPA: transglycosylase SLT domain-containing protein [Paracoccaceae bacterium]|nr:transglycosylase SLT domain-containing protein [Paracoccaceae bacterium]HMO73639.1 transglycosylase SLT domain-containing protein [Paracoccaceae bacterium]